MYFVSMYVTGGLWKTDVKAIGLQMATLYCPITIVATLNWSPGIDRSQHRQL